MSKVSDKVLEIEELAQSGIPNEAIAEFLDVPLSWVNDVVEFIFVDEEAEYAGVL